MKHIGALAILLSLVLGSPHRVAAETELDSVVKQLSAPEDYNRSRAAHTIGQMGNDAISAFDSLYEVALSDNIPGVRHAAAGALGKIAHQRAVSRFIQELQTNSVATVREYSVDALMQRSLRDAKATTPLFQALRDKNEKVRDRAAIALQFYKNAELEKLLLESLSDPTDKAREWAPWLLGRMHSEAALAPLHALLENGSPDFRKSVVAALRDIQSKTSVSPLIEVVNRDDNDEVRMRTIECLGELGDREAAATVVAALDDENPEVRAYAAGAIGALGVEEAKELLREMATTGQGQDKLAAIGALCQLKDASVIPIIAGEVKKAQNPEQALFIMRYFLILDAQDEINQLLEHENEHVRVAATNCVNIIKRREKRRSSNQKLQPTPLNAGDEVKVQDGAAEL